MKSVRLTKRRFLKREGLVNSYITLVNLYKYTLELWTTSIKTLHDQYKSIKSRQDIPLDIKIRIRAELELQVLNKVMELVENLASISYALTHDDKEILDNLVDFNKKTGLNPNDFYKNVHKLKNDFFYKLMSYPDLNKSNISSKEKTFLRKIYYHNIKFIKKMYKLMRLFRDKNLIAYNKLRHSRPMYIGIGFNYKDCYACTIISSRGKKNRIIKTSVYHGEFIMDKYLTLARLLLQLQKDILWSRIVSYECEGFKDPILTMYFKNSEDVNRAIEKIKKNMLKKVKRYSIKADLHFRNKINRVNKGINFYRDKVWNLNQEADVLLNKYARDILNEKGHLTK